MLEPKLPGGENPDDPQKLKDWKPEPEGEQPAAEGEPTEKDIPSKE
jgi:hypothetical protein